MKLAAIMPVRNEDWVLGFSARAALRWCDLLVCLNHASTDRSRAILEELATEYPGRVLIVDHEDPEWREMEHRQWLLTIARQYDATHIALVDADEVLCGDSLPHVRAQIERLPAGRCVNVRMYCMWRGIQQYRTDPGSVWSNRRDLALAFCDAPRLAWAAAEDGYQHHARAPQHSRSNPFSARLIALTIPVIPPPTTRAEGVMVLERRYKGSKNRALATSILIRSFAFIVAFSGS